MEIVEMDNLETLRRRLAESEGAVSAAKDRLDAAEREYDASLVADTGDGAAQLRGRNKVSAASASWAEACRKRDLIEAELKRVQAAEAEATRTARWQESDRMAEDVIATARALANELKLPARRFAELFEKVDAFRVALPRGGSNLPAAWTFEAIGRLMALELHRASGGRFPSDMPFPDGAPGIEATVVDVLFQLQEHRPHDIPRPTPQRALPSPQKRVFSAREARA